MKKDFEPGNFLKGFKGKIFKEEYPTIPELVLIDKERFPNKKGFTLYSPRELSLTYKEIYDYMEKIADYLISLGYRKGDKIGLTGKNSPEWAIAYLSILYMGGIVVPIDYQLPVEDIEKLMKFSSVEISFIDEEKYNSIGNKGILKLKRKISLSPNIKENYILNLEPSNKYEKPQLDLKDLAAILFTSGTTGNPKGVMLTHKNLVSDCFLSQYNLHIYETDVFYALLPIHHVYTMLAVFIEGISVGAEIVFGQRIATQVILNDLKTAKVTMFLGVPLLFNKLIKGIMKKIRQKGLGIYVIVKILMGISGFLKKVFNAKIGKKLFKSLLEQASLYHIRILISGGGPLPAKTFRQFNELGLDFVQGYGLTETSPIVALNPVEHFKVKSVGKIIPEVDVKIDVKNGKIGEILVKGPIVMQGYYKNEEETKKVFTEDGYLKTGDMGYLDKENYLYITGREKNVIVTEGGKNVFPEEIEFYYELEEGIEQVLVSGYLKNKKSKSEDIEVLIYPDMNYYKEKLGELTDEELKNKIFEDLDKKRIEINSKFPHYKKVKRLILLNEPMEMTTTKKIKRFKIKKGVKNGEK